jgi:hypothetical protein
MAETGVVPKLLRIWFVVHFVIDFAFALPLMVVPSRFLSLLGWTVVDPIAARLVSAALLGIGIESLLSRNASMERFRGMLSLKIIWSTSAVAGLLFSLIQNRVGWPFFGWALLVVFAGFNVLWVYWKLRIEKLR